MELYAYLGELDVSKIPGAKVLSASDKDGSPYR
jgi:hypothetical protein